MTTQPLRACDEFPDIEELIESALDQVQRTYTNLAQVMMITEHPNADTLCVMIARAQAANSKMLSSLRHPSGGRR